MIPGAYNIVAGAQAGSESKGKMGAFLARKYKPDVICMASCPNSGHTVIMGDHKYVTYHLPASWIGHRDAMILLGPTSTISLPILQKEIAMLGITPDHLRIHPRAVMIRDHYLREEREKGLLTIGSTNQGVGVARREKLMRNPDVTFAGEIKELCMYVGDTTALVNKALDGMAVVMHEMTQGFDLDLEHGIDPRYCTSKMINPAMAMAEMGVSPRMVGSIYGVLRPYPIRVNNREGSSGPYADAEEITWADVAARCHYPHGELMEITTTTKLPRRVFEFSVQRIRKFVQVCRPTSLCLQFANYIDWRASGVREFADLPIDVQRWMAEVESLTKVPFHYVGTGPDMDDMIDISYSA